MISISLLVFISENEPCVGVNGTGSPETNCILKRGYSQNKDSGRRRDVTIISGTGSNQKIL